MAICYEFFVIGSRVQIMRDGDQQDWADSGCMLLFTEEAKDMFDYFLKPFNLNNEIWINRLEVNYRYRYPIPWAMIAYPKEYRLGGHLCSIRSRKEAVTFSGYSVKPGHKVDQDGVPPLSFIEFHNKRELKNLASLSQLLIIPWKLLSDKDEEGNWICFANPLPEDWVAMTEKGDDELFMKIYKGQLN